ncbi:MAG: hypothetical protein WC679_00970 [Bacteroidales bacterium]
MNWNPVTDINMPKDRFIMVQDIRTKRQAVVKYDFLLDDWILGFIDQSYAIHFHDKGINGDYFTHWKEIS